MLNNGPDAACVAFEVGYKSATQFIVNTAASSANHRGERFELPNSNWGHYQYVVAGIPPYSSESVQLKNSPVIDLLKSWIEVSRKVRTPRAWFLFH
jgi:hypothetical protein